MPKGYDAGGRWKSGSNLPYLIAGLVVGLMAIIAICFVITYRSIDEQGSRDETRRADVIIVLGAAVWAGEKPGLSLKARTQRAIDLYRDGYASWLILTGGLGDYPPEEAEVMRRLAVEAGIPSGTLLLEKESHSTWESLVGASEIMQGRAWATAIIVSDPYHMRRALLMAGDLGLTAHGSPVYDSPNHRIATRRIFYTSREVVALWWYLVQRWLGIV